MNYIICRLKIHGSTEKLYSTANYTKNVLKKSIFRKMFNTVNVPTTYSLIVML